MPGIILISIGSIMVIGWGIAHIAVTKSVVDGFGDISQDNRHYITQEWIAEGITQIFIGILVTYIAFRHGVGSIVSLEVAVGSAVLLIVLAVLTQLTGSRTPVIPFKICPYILTIVAVLYIVGNLI